VLHILTYIMLINHVNYNIITCGGRYDPIAQDTKREAEHQTEKVCVSTTDVQKPKNTQSLAPLLRKTRRAVTKGGQQG